MAKQEKSPGGPPRPANTPHQRENQLIALTQDLVEMRLRDGTASAQETVHFLRLATEKTRLEQEKITMENELMKAKKEHLESSKLTVELVNEVKDMLRVYQGRDE